MAGEPSGAVQIGIVESDDQSRQFMSAVIGGTPGLRVSCACSTGRDALWAFAQNQRPNLFVLSLFLKDMTGTELIQRTRVLWPDLVSILLIPQNSPRLLIEALESGASAYLPKPCGAEDLLRAISTVHDGGAVISSHVAKGIVDYFRARGLVFRLLTERERQVLTCMSRGFSQHEIATELGIDKATVRTHVKNILGKLGAHSSAEAIAFYLNPKAPSLPIELPAYAMLPLVRSAPAPTLKIRVR